MLIRKIPQLIVAALLSSALGCGAPPDAKSPHSQNGRASFWLQAPDDDSSIDMGPAIAMEETSLSYVGRDENPLPIMQSPIEQTGDYQPPSPRAHERTVDRSQSPLAPLR